MSQAWEYEYDSRSRLIHALRFSDSGKPQFRQAFEYDEADNMTSVTTLTFTEKVWDTFADGNYTASPPWTVQSGTWSAAAYDLAPVPATGTRTISTATTTRSPDLRLDYYLPPSLQGLLDSFSVYVRYVDASNYLRVVWVWGSLVVYEAVAGVETPLAMFPYVSLTMDSWQTLAVQVRNDKLAVYHAPRGKAPRLLGGDIAVSTTMNTNALRLGVSGQSGFRFDNVSAHARALDAAKSTTYAYNTSNQLTSSVTDGTTTTYTYDAWGRLLTRTAGTASASYAYRGDKLKQVTSTFPGESTVAMNYDGLGRRRNRMANGVTPITWWRYGLGWDTVAEYTDNDTDWAVEGFSKFNVMTDFMHPLAEATVASGQPPANAAYSYLALDHLSSTRGVFSQTKTQTGTMEFLPYGARHTTTSGTLPHHQFTAKPYDTGTGLYTFPYRHYSSAMARWTGADPAGIVDGPNVYGYVRGHSIAHNDPTGESMLRIPPTGPDDKDDCISGWDRCNAGPIICFACIMKCTAQGKWPSSVPDVFGCDHSCGPGPEKKPRRRRK